MQQQDPQWIDSFNGEPDDELAGRVRQWFEQKRSAKWMPIWSRENWPTLPLQLLCLQERSPNRQALMIYGFEDLCLIPEGITGWLLPDGEDDTDVVVGLWEGKTYFFTMTNTQTGAVGTLQSRIAWARSFEVPGGHSPK